MLKHRLKVRLRLGIMGVKTYQSRVISDPESIAGPGEVIAYTIMTLFGTLGAAINAFNLDKEPCMRSHAIAFVMVNLGIGYVYGVGLERDWTDFVPILVGMALFGLVLGLLLSEGDVQKEMKEMARNQTQHANTSCTKTF